MSKARKKVVRSIILASIIIGLVFIVNSITPKTYTSTKKECEKILKRYQVEMEQIAIASLKLDKRTSGNFKEYFYSCDQEGFVQFDIGEQGMLGGQYWALVYTQDGKFHDETDSYIYEEVDGNNIWKAEKLNEHWWFLWIDYDGTIIITWNKQDE